MLLVGIYIQLSYLNHTSNLLYDKGTYLKSVAHVGFQQVAPIWVPQFQRLVRAASNRIIAIYRVPNTADSALLAVNTAHLFLKSNLRCEILTLGCPTIKTRANV